MIDEETKTYRAWQKETLEQIKIQTVKTNGRVTRLEKWLLVVGVATTVTILLKFPEYASLLSLI